MEGNRKGVGIIFSGTGVVVGGQASEREDAGTPLSDRWCPPLTVAERRVGGG